MKDFIKYFIITCSCFYGIYYCYSNNFFDLFGSQPQLLIVGNNNKDFDVIKKGYLTEHYFVFTNSGEQDLVIYNVETTCGCTAPIWNEGPIKKNEKDSIKVSYDSSIIGKFDKPIFIYSNSEEKQITLRIKGEIIN